MIQVRDCGGSGDGEKWMDVRCSFKVESMGLAEEFGYRKVRLWKRF